MGARFQTSDGRPPALGAGMSRGGLCESGGAPTDDGLITSGEARVSHHRARREEGEG